jgi:hypothetical protein
MTIIVKLGKGRRRKVTAAQEEELAKLYRDHGIAACEERCRQLGVSPKYPASAAAAKGLHRPLSRKGNRYKDNRVDRSIRSHNDPRWERAKAIGTVVI